MTVANHERQVPSSLKEIRVVPSTPLFSRRNIKQASLFCSVGFLNFIVDIVVYFGTYHWLHFNYIAAQAVSYPCGALNSYLLNRRLTFARKGMANGWEIVRFALLNVCSILASVGALYVAKHDILLSVQWSKISANLTALCINFAGSKWFVFRKRADAN